MLIALNLLSVPSTQEATDVANAKASSVSSFGNHIETEKSHIVNLCYNINEY